MASGVAKISLCAHTRSDHLFNAPLCKHLSTMQKVACIAFHILTFMIPWIIYQFYSLLSRCIQKGETLLPSLAPPELCAEALAFARAELAKHPDLPPFVFRTMWQWNSTHQPCNPEIARLAALRPHMYEQLVQAFKDHPNDPWSQEAVIQAADAYFKVNYATSVLTLEDLPAFQGKVPDRTIPKILTEQDSYQFRTFFHCPLAYNFLRGRATVQKENLQFPRQPPSNKEVAAFFQSGTLQNQWRQLYNDYCNRIQKAVPAEAEPKKRDTAWIQAKNWTKQDFSFKFVGCMQDTLPT